MSLCRTEPLTSELTLPPQPEAKQMKVQDEVRTLQAAMKRGQIDTASNTISKCYWFAAVSAVCSAHCSVLCAVHSVHI